MARFYERPAPYGIALAGLLIAGAVVSYNDGGKEYNPYDEIPPRGLELPAASPTFDPYALNEGQISPLDIPGNDILGANAYSTRIIASAFRCVALSEAGASPTASSGDYNNERTALGRDGERGTKDDQPVIRANADATNRQTTISVANTTSTKVVVAVVNGRTKGDQADPIFRDGNDLVTPMDVLQTVEANAETTDAIRVTNGTYSRGVEKESPNSTATWNIVDLATGRRSETADVMSTLAVQQKVEETLAGIMRETGRTDC